MSIKRTSPCFLEGKQGPGVGLRGEGGGSVEVARQGLPVAAAWTRGPVAFLLERSVAVRTGGCRRFWLALGRFAGLGQAHLFSWPAEVGDLVRAVARQRGRARRSSFVIQHQFLSFLARWGAWCGVQSRSCAPIFLPQRIFFVQPFIGLRLSDEGNRGRAS
ncbi:MAG: hypothetical protein UY23_C0001G0030 [Candidatus Jorgensenbacteria bacterium GW2011_GWA1_48_11]|uniref:Uncharacterized protein n=1 Tax=Candidatus Jorgensenbacteria bacterium GW2011_GWA1_48_11 TaxID=1618660 RepID=A0A0G1UBC9_9BACT|nr:MAG: hypothetical protein UY23_C0001G0030 [Candidatus Jorgensenbacteria bacterium GW2011_GWA1_48_11]KKW11919.1 MAG: hypothetical protein UY51_C0005G0161 [Candidatus Jorgensenbacteria bacterium GW2011_GWB1_49_9]